MKSPLGIMRFLEHTCKASGTGLFMVLCPFSHNSMLQHFSLTLINCLILFS